MNIRNKLLKKVEDETNEKKKGRSDTKIPNVMISDRRVKTAAKYKISDIPHPFTSREEYERSMQMPLGGKNQNQNRTSVCMRTLSLCSFAINIVLSNCFLKFHVQLHIILLSAFLSQQFVIKCTSSNNFMTVYAH